MTGIFNITILIKLSILLELAVSTVTVETHYSNIDTVLRGFNPEIVAVSSVLV